MGVFIMLMTFIILTVTIYFIFCKYTICGALPQRETEKVATKLRYYLLIAPLLALVVFAILFTAILQGKLYERSSHALLVLMLWLYATSFYLEILRFYKNKKLIVFNIIAIFISITLAVTLTPLDRFNALIYSHLQMFSYGIGIFMLMVYYICNIKFQVK
jgi:hypothetical protein